MSDVLKSNVEYNYGNSIEAMNQILSDAHVLWVKTHQAHWYMINSRNVMSDFLILHDWLDKPLDFLLDLIDDVAERIVMLNGRPVSTLKSFLDSTILQEEDIDYFEYSSDDLLSRTVADFKAFRDELSNAIKIMDSEGNVSDSSKLQDDLSETNKYIWFMQATLGRTTLNNNFN